MFLFALLSINNLIAIFSISVIISNPIFAQKSMQTYPNEKCGISINYPKDWKAENVDYKSEGIRPIVNISPDLDDTENQVSINLWDISDYREKTIEYVSEVKRGSVEMGEELGEEVTIMQDEVLEIGGFPTQKLVYIIGTPGEYEFQEEKAWTMELNILAYDRVYEINLQTENQENFDEYSPIVEQIKNTLKISKPNFEGINC